MHLRTMINHLPEWSLTGAPVGCNSARAADGGWRGWFDEACDARSFKRRRIYVMADAPRLVTHLLSAFPHHVRVNPMMLQACTHASRRK